MSTKSTKRHAEPKRAKPAPKTDLVPIPIQGWLRQFKCGCTTEAPDKEQLKPWCPNHLRDPEGEPVPILKGHKRDEPKKMGRPIKYSDDLARIVCAKVAQGWRQRHFDPERCIPKLEEEGHSPEEAARICDELPARATIGRWLADYHDFRVQYLRAKHVFLESGMAEEIEDIADNATNDYVLTPKGFALDHEHVSRSKLRVEQRRWAMDRMLPAETVLKIKGDKEAPLLLGRAGAQQLSDEELVHEILMRRAEKQRTLEGPKREGE